MLSIFNNASRFFEIQGKLGTWYYDSFTHGLYKIGKNFDAAEKILKNIEKDIHSIPEKKKSAYVMLNTSNRCNLNCSYTKIHRERHKSKSFFCNYILFSKTAFFSESFFIIRNK